MNTENNNNAVQRFVSSSLHRARSFIHNTFSSNNNADHSSTIQPSIKDCPDNSIHTGWLWKGPDPYKFPFQQLFKRKWKRRWFIVYKPPCSLPDSFNLEFYRNETSQHPLGSIELQNCDKIINYNENISTNTGDLISDPLHSDYHFLISSFGTDEKRKIYFLRADTEAEMKNWIDLLSQLCSGLQKSNSSDQFCPSSSPHLHTRSQENESRRVVPSNSYNITPVSSPSSSLDAVVPTNGDILSNDYSYISNASSMPIRSQESFNRPLPPVRESRSSSRHSAVNNRQFPTHFPPSQPRYVTKTVDSRNLHNQNRSGEDSLSDESENDNIQQNPPPPSKYTYASNFQDLVSNQEHYNNNNNNLKKPMRSYISSSHDYVNLDNEVSGTVSRNIFRLPSYSFSTVEQTNPQLNGESPEYLHMADCYSERPTVHSEQPLISCQVPPPLKSFTISELLEKNRRGGSIPRPKGKIQQPSPFLDIEGFRSTSPPSLNYIDLSEAQNEHRPSLSIEVSASPPTSDLEYREVDALRTQALLQVRNARSEEKQHNISSTLNRKKK